MRISIIAVCSILLFTQGFAAEDRELESEEISALFKVLGDAAKLATTLSAEFKKSEATSLVLDVEPVVTLGRLKVEHPNNFYQEVFALNNKNREVLKSKVIANATEAWIYSVESREARHMNLCKKKEEQKSEIDRIRSWLMLDLEAIKASFELEVYEVDVLPGLSMSKLGKDNKLKTTTPQKFYRIDAFPLDEESKIVQVSIWVDGIHPWPYKYEKENSDEDLTTYELSSIVLGSKFKKNTFKFKPPRGCSVENL